MDRPLPASGVVELLPKPPAVSAAWAPFALQIAEPPPHLTGVFADHVLTLRVAGKHRLRQEINGRVVEGWSGPGCANLVPARTKATYDTAGPCRIVAMYIPDAFVSRVVEEHWGADPRHVEIRRQFLVRDLVMESVLTSLAREAQDGGSRGNLYAESACEFLAHHLIHAYSSLSATESRMLPALSGSRLKLVLDFIQDNLAQPIASKELADLIGISIRHFERAFRQAIGVSPHAYVLQKRISAARNLLQSQPTRKIDEIAADLGFSSASHLGSAFRRETGCSPANFRRLRSS